MYQHTATRHKGQIGPDRGSNDYLFKITSNFTDNLSRQTNEGLRQTNLEKFQAERKVSVLNSKIDFCQPMRTNLNVITKANNPAPGIQDTPSDFRQRVRRQIRGIRRLGPDRLIPDTAFKPQNSSTPKKTVNPDRNSNTTVNFSPVKKRVKFTIDPNPGQLV